jgi:CBS domain-containing protein
MTVRDIMTPEPACCTQDTPVQQVAQTMRDLNVGSIPVVSDMNSKKVIGMITDRDITIRAIANCMDCSSTTVAQCMTTEVSSCPQNSNLEDCLKTMEGRQIRRIPVVNENGSLVGIVAQADIALAAGDNRTGDLVEKVSRPYMS